MILRKKVMLLAAIILIVILALGGLVYFNLNLRDSKNEVRLSGKIVRADFRGILDGDDYITMDLGQDGLFNGANLIQIKVRGGKSESNSEWGKVIGIDLGQPGNVYLGKMIKVYAVKYAAKVDSNNTFTSEMEENELTLQGDKKYFIEAVP